MNADNTPTTGRLLARLALAYIIYAPFWAVVIFIHWKLVEAFDQEDYITYCLRCGYPIVFAISIFVIVTLVYKTIIRIWQNITAKEIARELGINALLLLGLVLFLIVAYPIVTFTWY